MGSLDTKTGKAAGGANGDAAAGPRPGAMVRAARWVWRRLTSLRLTLWLLGILASAMAVATVVTSLVPQNAPFEAYLKVFGTLLGPLIAKTTLRNIYGSWWFIGAFVLLAMSLVACVIQRAARLRQQERDWPGPVTEQGITSGAYTRWRFPQGAREAADGLAAALRGAGYAVTEVPVAEAGKRALAGRRGRLTPWAPIIVHAGLVVILLGAAWGRWPSHTYQTRVSLRPGEVYPVRTAGEAFGLRLVDAGAERDAMGRPTKYWAKAEVLEEGEVVRATTIRSNAPLRYHGISATLYSMSEASREWQQVGWVGEKPVRFSGITFRLVPSATGYAVEMTKGKEKSLVPIALGTDGTVDPMRSVTQVDDPAGVVFVHRLRDKDEQGRPALAAQVFLGGSGQGGATLDLDRDVGIPIVFAGFVIISLGALLVLGAPRSRVVALLTEGAKGSSALVRLSPAGDQWQAERLWRQFESRLGAERQPDRGGKLRTAGARRGEPPLSA